MDRLGAGLSPGLRKGPAPIDKHAQIFSKTLDSGTRPADLADLDHGEDDDL
jgi:hypothetical protein